MSQIEKLLEKNDLRTMQIIVTDPAKPQYRRIRDWIVELYDEGIFFIPIGEYTYLRFEYCSMEQRLKYLWTEIKRAVSLWKKLRKLKKHFTDEMLKELHDGGLNI